MRSLFRKGSSRCSFDHIAFVNTDMILLHDFFATARRISGLVSPTQHILLMCGRFDLIGGSSSYDPRYSKRRTVRRLVRTRCAYDQSGQDTLVFRKGLWDKIDIPPFGLGGCWWDNWFCWAAEKAGAMVIDTGQSVTTIHQRHLPSAGSSDRNNSYNSSLFGDIGWYWAIRAPYQFVKGRLVDRNEIPGS